MSTQQILFANNLAQGLHILNSIEINIHTLIILISLILYTIHHLMNLSPETSLVHQCHPKVFHQESAQMFSTNLVPRTLSLLRR